MRGTTLTFFLSFFLSFFLYFFTSFFTSFFSFYSFLSWVVQKSPSILC